MSRFAKPAELKTEWLPRADIPNTEGYRLTILMDDNRQLCTRVLKNSVTGCHYVNLPEGINNTFASVRGWKPRK